jgi:eukaryotic-like serine/threonine-protein kinase
MTPQEWEKVSEIYHAASELEPDKWSEFLDAACDGETTLRHEVESLLAANGEAQNFISEPVVANFASDLLNSNGPEPNAMIGHYRIVKKVGSGGMGEVFHAVDTKLGRDVAIKSLSSLYDDDPTFLKRFRNEARAAASLNHPNVATVYSVEEIGGVPLLTMEYVDGQTLDKFIPDNGLELNKFLEWFEPIADALCKAHERGIVHRDIKPGNIMISADGTPKILDFGLARIDPATNSKSMSRFDITAPGQILGTPSYMSPEQAEGGDVDVRSDVFSFGTVMYEALTGKRPFRGPSDGMVVQAVIYAKPEPICPQKPSVPKVVAKMVARCLQKSPEKRFRSMKDVHSVLKDVRGASDGGLSMDSFARRFYREATSPSKKWWAAAAALVLAIASGGWFLFSRPTNKPPINFENMAMRRLSETDNVGYAQISADGKTVLYGSFEPDGRRALWIRRVEDRNALLLTSEQKQFWGGLALSPDGGQAFYLTAELTGTHGTLYRISTIGGPPRKLVDVANDVGGISPDGERILLVRYGEPAQIISVKTSDGSDEQAIVTGVSHGLTFSNFRDPQYSHDAKAVYFIRNSTTEGVENWSVEELRLDTGGTRVLYSQSERISELAVLPGSVGLLMTAVDPVSNLQQIFQISLTDGSKSRVTNDLFFYFGVSIDREAKYVVASQRADEQRVWVGESSDPATVKPLSGERNVNRTVDWMPDGRIVYDGYENNVSHIWISDADGRNVRKLTDGETDDVDPHVSGDGRFIIFTSKRSGRGQVWRMDADGSHQTLLTDINGVSGYPRFAADGQTVVFEWLYETRRVLASIPVAGGPVTEIRSLDDIPRNNGFYWAPSPDGRYLAQSIWEPSSKQTKISLEPLFANGQRRILNIWPSAILKWTPDGKNIIYRERRAGYFPEGEVQKLDIASGKTTKLISAALPEIVIDLSYSRDGKKIALVRGKNTSNAVMLIPSSQK